MTEESNNVFPLGKQNYIIMAAGFALVVIGFLLMTGGKAPDPTVFEHDVIFSTRRISVAPVTILIGLGVVMYGIIKKPKAD